MPIDPIFKVLRTVSGGGERRCPKCRKEKLVIVEKTDEKRTGVICRECGWGILDPKSERHEVKCAGDGCGESMGLVELPEGVGQKKYLCVECTKERREKKVAADPEGSMTRYAVLCEGGCGSQQMWLDFPETEKGPAPEKLRGGYCRPCASKLKPAMVKNNTEEKIIRETMEALKKKQAAGQPVTQEDMLGLVDRLLKARKI